MITVEEALAIVESTIHSTSKVQTIFLNQALNLVLAENVFSPIDMPPFPQSAMDGYAVNYQSKDDSFELVGEVAAGDSSEIVLNKNQAVRIFTGAKEHS